MRHFSTGFFRPLAALCSGFFNAAAVALPLLCVAAPAAAGELIWEALPDRERIRITLSVTEGMPGKVGRIAPTGVVIPFTQMPTDVLVTDTPAGARIFKRTRAQGRALVLVTQTPEFGFVVSKNTPKEVVVDFFPNPLGARWKPSGPSPVTELPPEHVVTPVSEPDAANAALVADPQGAQQQAGAKTEADRASAPAQPSPVPQPAPAAEPSPPQSAAPAAPSAEPPAPAQTPAPPAVPPPPVGAPVIRGEVQPAQQQPVVVELNGSPQRALAETQMAVPPADSPPAVAPSGTPGAEQPKPTPLLDTRRETAERAAALPQPAPPLSVTGGGSHVSGTVQLQDSAPAVSGVVSIPVAPQPAGAETPPPSPQPQPPARQEQPVAVPAPSASPGVGASMGQGVYGGTVNLGGLESLPNAPQQPPAPQTPGTEAAPSPAAPQGQAPVSTVQEQPAAQGHAAADGQEGPPPLVPEQALAAIRNDIQSGRFQPALDLAQQLLDGAVLTPAQQEELLHIKAEMLFAINKDNLAERYMDIMDASNKAFYFNQQSPRNAGVLLRQGYMSLKLKNIPEAEARFNLLRRLFPNDETIPLTYYYWGDYYFARGELQKAADEFQYLLQHYPNSRYTREAALALARTFYRLGYYEQAFNIVDYIEKRWERFYVEYPPFLNMMGDVAFRLRKLDNALKNYWLYLNLAPSGEEADIILTRIGDIYSQQREKAAAREVYNESARRFPDKDGGLVAMMRLAEEGIYDDPSVASMFSLFDGPLKLAPAEVYKTIIAKHPGSALVPLAEIKLALWYLWKHEYGPALDLMSEFEHKYPAHELVAKAREIAVQTFGILASEAIAAERFGYILQIWDKYPIVRNNAAEMPLESQLALSVALRREGRPDEALRLITPFFLSKSSEYSDMALSLALSIYLEYEQWRSIRDVARRVELWEIKPETQEQLEYALALAAENLGESDVAAPLWQRLYDSGKLPPAQMAYATFFLAREAQRNENLEIAYNLGQEALRRLMEEAERAPNRQDVGKIQTQLASLLDISERAGRLREALGFAQDYLGYLPENSPERTVVRYRMARIFKKQGDAESWKNILTEIADKDPASVYGQLAASELRAASIAEEAARYSPTGRL